MASHRIPFESLSADERNRLIAENDRLRQQLRDRHRDAALAGDSPAIRRVSELIAQVAASPHSVLFLGEEGVGKTRAARAVHAASTRSAGPFVVVTCASVLETDVDAQLFGHDRGSRGLPERVAGAVGRAGGGTLLFDDVADLGPLGQERFLRLARERTWERPDGTRVRVDARVMAVTSRDLDHDISTGRFRRDVRDHLNALAIRVPPLRERKSDLPALADLFVERFARDHARAVSRVSARAIDMLMNYHWPGNVSELRQTLERAVVLTSGPTIHHHHLPAEIQASGDAAAAPAVGLSEALDAYEKELLQDALKQARGVRSRAACLLMTSERVFSYRLRKHRIDARRFKAS